MTDGNGIGFGVSLKGAVVALAMCFSFEAHSNAFPTQEPVEMNANRTLKNSDVLGDESSTVEPSRQYELVGSTRLRFLWFDIYRAELFSGDGRFSGLVPPLKLNLIYLRDISQSDLLEQTREQLQDGTDPRLLEQWLENLGRVWPDVKEGQQLAFEMLSEDKGRFYFDGVFLAELESPGFAAAFINIWLNEKGPYARHARALKGQSS